MAEASDGARDGLGAAAGEGDGVHTAGGSRVASGGLGAADELEDYLGPVEASGQTKQRYKISQI